MRHTMRYIAYTALGVIQSANSGYATYIEQGVGVGSGSMDLNRVNPFFDEAHVSA